MVCREVDMLTETEKREKRQKLRGESVCRIIEINVKVSRDEMNSQGVVAVKERKELSHRRRHLVS